MVIIIQAMQRLNHYIPAQENYPLSCRKSALAAKPCVHMTWETSQIQPLVSGFDLPPWSTILEVVTNWQIFQKPPQNTEPENISFSLHLQCSSSQTMCSYDLGNHSKEVSGIWLRFATLIIKIGGGHQLADIHKCAANSRKAQKPSFCKMAATKMALESLFLRLETCPGSLCGAQIKTLQMRPSQTKSEVVTNWRIFQKPPWNQENW